MEIVIVHSATQGWSISIFFSFKFNKCAGLVKKKKKMSTESKKNE